MRKFPGIPEKQETQKLIRFFELFSLIRIEFEKFYKNKFLGYEKTRKNPGNPG